jgi:hypothetical protein
LLCRLHLEGLMQRGVKLGDSQFHV